MLASHPFSLSSTLQLLLCRAGGHCLRGDIRESGRKGGGDPSILSTRNGGFIALLETDWRQAWVPCWLNPGADEHLMEGGG